ncbi:MAG TPA: hypothetical protein VKE91_08170 [Blastocatellia bacterium]|nr:hypothetical protein [Blastocatellia bacterium]
MKAILFVLLAPFFIGMIHSIGPATTIDPGKAEGTLQVNEKNITLRHAYAHLHDNAEGLLEETEKLRVLVTDREVSPNELAGIAFLPVMELAKQGRVQGLLFEMAPDDPNNVVMTLLTPSSKPGQFLIRETINVTDQELFKDWSLTGQRVAGAIERHGAREPNLSDFPAVSYSIRFSAPVFNEPSVTADLKGKAALDSPQARVLSTKADALAKGDFAAVRSLSTERANRQNQGVFALGGEKATLMARQAGAEMKKNVSKIQRVVERGDRAVVIFSSKQWATFVREGGIWKSDN